MSQQPELTSLPLFPDPAPAPEFRPAPPRPARHAPPQIPRWLSRAELFVRVALKIFIGQWVMFAPWSHRIWDDNILFVRFPTLSIFAANGAVRGVVSGLGILTMWITLRNAFSRQSRD
jgi:hypothetical protein